MGPGTAPDCGSFSLRRLVSLLRTPRVRRDAAPTSDTGLGVNWLEEVAGVSEARRTFRKRSSLALAGGDVPNGFGSRVGDFTLLRDLRPGPPR
jgi:hypothetical protein